MTAKETTLFALFQQLSMAQLVDLHLELLSLCPIRSRLFTDALLKAGLDMTTICRLMDIESPQPPHIPTSAPSTSNELTPIYNTHRELINSLLMQSITPIYDTMFSHFTPEVLRPLTTNDPVKTSKEILAILTSQSSRQDTPRGCDEQQLQTTHCRPTKPRKITTEFVYGEVTLAALVGILWSQTMDEHSTWQYHHDNQTQYQPPTNMATEQKSNDSNDSNDFNGCGDSINSSQSLSSHGSEGSCSITDLKLTNDTIRRFIPTLLPDYDYTPRLYGTYGTSMKKRVFVDLGGGIGKCSLPAPFLLSFTHCISIELLVNLHNTAVSIAQDQYQPLIQHTDGDGDGDRDRQSRNEDACRMTIQCGSFFDIDWSFADIVLANSTCFTDEMFIQISEQCTRLAPGSIIISLSEPLQGDHLQQLSTHYLPMSWNHADVFIHRRI